MLIYVNDQSKGKSFIKNRRLLAECLSRITNRSFLGDLPYWVIKNLIKELKANASKQSKVAVFVDAKKMKGTGFMGWKCFYIGNNSLNRFKNFIESESFIDLNK